MDKRITITTTNADGVVIEVTGWLEDWILAIYEAMYEDQRRAVRKELKRFAEREKLRRW